MEEADRMEPVNKKLCKEWCSQNGFEINGNVIFSSKQEKRKKTVIFPESYRGCAALVVLLSHYFQEFSSESLFWIREWGIGSPEAEDIGHLILKEISPLPGLDSLWEFPGVQCGVADAEHVRALLLLAMVHPWDACWIEKGGQSLINVCHDGYITAATCGPQEFDIVAWLSGWRWGPETFVG